MKTRNEKIQGLEKAVENLAKIDAYKNIASKAYHKDIGYCDIYSNFIYYSNLKKSGIGRRLKNLGINKADITLSEVDLILGTNLVDVYYDTLSSKIDNIKMCEDLYSKFTLHNGLLIDRENLDGLLEYSDLYVGANLTFDVSAYFKGNKRIWVWTENK